MPPIESHLPASGKPLDLEVSRLRKTYSGDPVVIDGIVGEASQSTFSARVFGGGYRVHMFSFVAWKVANGDVQTGELILSRAIPNSDDFEYRLGRHSYHRIRALYSQQENRAVVLEGLDPEPCPEDLSAARDELSRPITVRHARFGQLTLDRGRHAFDGEIAWGGAEISVTFAADGENLHAVALRRAEQITQAEITLRSKVDEFLFESVLSELEDDGSDEQVESSMFEIQSVDFDDSGDVEFWYSDAGLWGEHSLVVRMDPNDQLSFSIEG